MALDPDRSRRGSSAPAAERTAPAVLDLPVLRVESQYRHETRNLQRQERARYSNLLWNMVSFTMGPRVLINQLVGPNQDQPLDYADESRLQANVGFYQSKSDPTELIQVLKFYTTYLMQQARKERDADKQRFLLFKAVDFARLIVQHSPLSVNADAEALVFGIFVALGSAHGGGMGDYMRSEETIYQLMRRLQVMPQELQLRLKLGDALLEQTSYADALVQYRTLLRILVRRREGADRHRGWIVARVADLFQRLSQITSTQLKDARKLRSFIDRFNRDFAEGGHTLPPLPQINVSTVMRVRQALLEEANRWYQQGVASPVLERRQRARMAIQLGENLNALRDHNRALAVLEEHYGLWHRIEETPVTLEEQAEYLRQLTGAAIQLKRRDVLGWANKESSDVSAKLGAIETQRREREQLRAALLG